MKRIYRLFLITIVLMALVPLSSYGSPNGYMTIKLTKENFSKYFEIKKYRPLKPANKHLSFEFDIRSKLLDKGYYVYDVEGYDIRGTVRYRDEVKTRGRIIRNDRIYPIFPPHKGLFGLDINPVGAKDNQFKYAYLSELKISKAEGEIIFIKPENIIGIEGKKGYADSAYYVKMKCPYNKKTPCKSHYDKVTGEKIVDYYYTILLDNPAFVQDRVNKNK